MNATGSNKVLYAAELSPWTKPLQTMAPSAKFEAVPFFQEMLDGDGSTAPYPYGKNFDEARNDPIIVLHSSGSTGKMGTGPYLRDVKSAWLTIYFQKGLPKPITITHGSVAAHDNDHNIPAPPGREKQDTTVFTLEGENRRMYLVLPFFHVSAYTMRRYF